MSDQWSRRRFLRQSILTGTGVFMTAGRTIASRIAANDKLNLGIIGVANRGGDNLKSVSSQNIVALCDIDDRHLGSAAQKFPMAKTYNDFRLLLEQKDIDAVVISTPDHMHAPAASLALQAGKHVYCEKPLAHSVYEVRAITEMARKTGKVTQMGIQIHAGDNYRRVVELVKGGAIGQVQEVHVWADRVWAGDSHALRTPPPPANIHWDLWLGPVAQRPYSPAYIPQNWRGWWAFGSGTLGDMGCHHIDLPFWALDLKTPNSVWAEGPPVDPETTPAWLIVHYDFPASQTMPAVKLHWYNGGKRPAYFQDGTLPQWGDGTVFVGEKGMLLADYNRHLLLPEKNFKGFKAPAPTIAASIGHHEEWIEACKTGGKTTCNFDYSGPLSEAVLLGNVAYRTNQTISWDATGLEARNCPEAAPLIKPEYHNGWRL